MEPFHLWLCWLATFPACALGGIFLLQRPVVVAAVSDESFLRRARTRGKREWGWFLTAFILRQFISIPLDITSGTSPNSWGENVSQQFIAKREREREEDSYFSNVIWSLSLLLLVPCDTTKSYFDPFEEISIFIRKSYIEKRCTAGKYCTMFNPFVKVSKTSWPWLALQKR